MILDNEIKLDFQDVLIRPKRSTLESRSQVNLERQITCKYGASFTGIPIIAANMATGTFEMLNSLSKYHMFTAIAKHHNDEWFTKFSIPSIEERNTLDFGFYTIGMNNDELDKLVEFAKSIPIYKPIIKICIDIANGYTQRFASFVEKVRESFPNNVIIAGNVATPEMVQELVIAGADLIKCGLGPGSACTTRLKSGVGYPQISTAIECSDAAHGLGAGIVLDGGMRCPGDVAKAFVANSDMVMIGGMFSGTDEQEGDLISKWFETDEIIRDPDTKKSLGKLQIEKQYKIWYGMSSEYAQELHMNGMKSYRTSEGRKEEVEYKGSVKNVVDDLLGGLRSAGTYIGANSIKNFGKCGTLIRVNRQHDRF